MVQCHELDSRLEKLEHDQHYNPTVRNRYNGIQRYVSAINPPLSPSVTVLTHLIAGNKHTISGAQTGDHYTCTAFLWLYLLGFLGNRIFNT